VIHHELGAEWVVYARPEHVWLGREEPPQPLAGILVSRCRDGVTLREEGRSNKIHQDLQLHIVNAPRAVLLVLVIAVAWIRALALVV